MASELAETQLKTITAGLIDKIINGLSTGNKLDTLAKNWWEENKIALIGLSVAEVSTIIRNAQNRKLLSKHYDELVASMTWKERIEFLKSGVEQLKESNSKKIRTATIIASIIEVLPKVLPLILAAV